MVASVTTLAPSDILIVDDEADIRLAVGGILQDEGFVTREAAEGDVFVHAAVLRRHGLESLTPGQKVMVRIAEGQKGLQVVEIRAA